MSGRGTVRVGHCEGRADEAHRENSKALERYEPGACIRKGAASPSCNATPKPTPHAIDAALAPCNHTNPQPRRPEPCHSSIGDEAVYEVQRPLLLRKRGTGDARHACKPCVDAINVQSIGSS